MKLRICLIDRSFSSSSARYTLRMAGTSKWADPSGSTGTVPRIRFSVEVTPCPIGCEPPPW